MLIDRHRPGFSLIELLVVVGIIALLVGILLPVLGNARSAARQAVDLSNLRQIMVAYSVYQDDHDGHVMWGYPPPTVNGIAIEARFPDGSLVPGLDARRYPWRLHPYINDNWALLYSNAGLSDADYDDWYGLSLTPSFGLNTTHVGGHAGPFRHGFVNDASGTQRPNRNAHVVFNQIEVRDASNLLVFAETQNRRGDGPAVPSFLGFEPLHDGYFWVDPPTIDVTNPNNGTRIIRPVWTAERQGLTNLWPAAGLGLPIGRHGTSVGSGFFDGHAAARSPLRLTDLEIWRNR